jgi:4-hydroxyphenylacetate 3-monooxygenase
LGNAGADWPPVYRRRREVWLRGERVKDVITQPGLAGGVRAIASLYDMQHDAKVGREMTYISPTSGDRVGLSFIIPRTKEELEARRAMMLNLARTTCGMIPRHIFARARLRCWGPRKEISAFHAIDR